MCARRHSRRNDEPSGNGNEPSRSAERRTPDAPSRSHITPRITSRTQNNETSHSGPPVEQSDRFYELPRALYPSIFGRSGLDVNEVRSIVRRLRRVQQGSGGSHRFHLIVESENGEVLIGGTERFDHVVTRVLFSPSISLEEMHEDVQVNLLARVLNNISWQSRVPFGGNSSGPVRRRGGQIAREDRDDQSPTRGDRRSDARLNDIGRRCPLANDSVSYWTREICDTLDFPTWFPYKDTCYKEPPQVSSELVYVDSEVVELFEFLETTQLVWIYRELFEYLHCEAKKKRIPGVPRMFKYACFTPPWFRNGFVKGNEEERNNRNPVRLEKVVLPDMRNQRSRMGAKRLAYILGAFYTREPDMTKIALKHLLRIVPISPTLQKRKSTPGKRKRSQRSSEDQGTPQRRRTSVSQPSAAATDATRDIINRENAVPIIPDDNSSAPRNAVPAAEKSGSEDSEDSRIRRLFEEDLDRERSSLQILDQTSVFARPQSETPREPNGDEEDHVIERTRTNLPSVQQMLTLPHETRQDDFYAIVCAFGNQCRFKDNPNMQDSSRITGRCRVESCRSIMHDLCGGGEFGDMTCLRCKSVR